MPAPSVLEVVVSALQLAWRAYRFAQDKIEEAKYQAALSRLNAAVDGLRSARSPQEVRNAVEELAATHSSILHK